MALRLAALDSAPNVAWLARPCQYTPRAHNAACQDNRWWTHGRLAEEVVAGTNAVIDALKASGRAARIHLVGYSGGGGLAVLVAARRSDVASIRTLAGNLDTAAFTNLHGVSPMASSLNPADVAQRVENIPQRHYVGGADKVVPAQIARAYRQRMKSTACIEVETVGGQDHASGWPAWWQSAVGRPTACRN